MFVSDVNGDDSIDLISRTRLACLILDMIFFNLLRAILGPGISETHELMNILFSGTSVDLKLSLSLSLLTTTING